MSLSEKLKPPVDYNFTLVDRIVPYIPREGLHPDARIKLAAAPHPKLPIPQFEPLSKKEGTKDLIRLWKDVLSMRARRYGGYIGQEEYSLLAPVALGSTTEQLFRNVIVPVVKEHCMKTKKTSAAIDNVSYLLPLWNKEELKPIQILEGELSLLIKQGGALRPDIGAVFIDYPPNQQNKEVQFNFSQLIKFIENNRDILIIIDQANLYFENTKDPFGDFLQKDLMFKKLGEDPDPMFQYLKPKHKSVKRPPDNSLVLVTNTATKSFGTSGSAIIVGTPRAEKLVRKAFGSQLPITTFENKKFLTEAREVLDLESFFHTFRIMKHYDKNYFDYPDAASFRVAIGSDKFYLEDKLKKLFGASVVCPELIVEGARIIVNAQKLGFNNAQELCDKLYDDFSIDTKPATVYVSPKKHEEWNKYVQMTAPWDKEMMTAVMKAFKIIHDQNHSTPLKLK